VSATSAARVAAAAGLGALAAALLLRIAGPVGLVVPLALLALLIPLSSPRIALGLLMGCAILFETSSPNVLHFTTDQIHDPLPGHFGLLELLMALAVCSVVLDASRRRRVPLRPAPFGPAVAILVIALLLGSVVGHFAGEGFNTPTDKRFCINGGGLKFVPATEGAAPDPPRSKKRS